MTTKWPYMLLVVIALGCTSKSQEKDSTEMIEVDQEYRYLALGDSYTIGESVAEAFVWMHRLEAACQYQVDGLAGGRELHFPATEVQETTRQQGYATLGPNGFAKTGFEWPALLRKLERDRGTTYRT